MAEAENRAPQARAVLLSMAAVATVFVAARVYGCSRILRRRLYVEEWLCVLSLAIMWLNVSFMTTGFFNGLGRHMIALSHDQQVKAKFWFVVGTPFSVTNLAVSKMSVVSLLCRIFKPGELHKAAMWASVILCLLGFLAVSFLAFFGCKPIRASWDPTIKGAKCIESIQYVQYCYFAAALSAALDLYFAVYPAIVFHRLTCNWRKKLTLSIMLGMGVSASAAGCYKTSRLEANASPDFTYDVTYLIIWTTTEGSLMLISACIPTLHPVYDRIQDVFRRLLGRATPQDDLANFDQEVDQPQRRMGGFWTEKLDSIVRSISSWTTTTTTANTSTVQTRTLEEAATITRPPPIIWYTNIVKSTHGLRSTSREATAYRPESYHDA
ncbi:hypothetical protein J7T55_009200 [Diaporthe amygdali]|uniref:uncharacterized protein n=1 Tax=Phomopsis amygdali TaxID=1214568 RepID=UPI0022FDD1DE|nr:uncharacterized protein J7T55_009200 [Diaporthe amygdali]KAJ0118417.1 hypothetical protein J7T55_009200 [Diaporthe amygdali]